MELTPLDVVDRAKQCLALIFERLETIASRRLNSPAIKYDVARYSHQSGNEHKNDSQTDMLPRILESAICVRKFDDSLSSAIRTTYRSLLRSSSKHEPRDPPLKVISFYNSN